MSTPGPPYSSGMSSPKSPISRTMPARRAWSAGSSSLASGSSSASRGMISSRTKAPNDVDEKPLLFRSAGGSRPSLLPVPVRGRRRCRRFLRASLPSFACRPAASPRPPVRPVRPHAGRSRPSPGGASFSGGSAPWSARCSIRSSRWRVWYWVLTSTRNRKPGPRRASSASSSPRRPKRERPPRHPDEEHVAGLVADVVHAELSGKARHLPRREGPARASSAGSPSRVSRHPRCVRVPIRIPVSSAGRPRRGVSPHISPTSCCGRQSARCDKAYFPQDASP